MTASFFYRLSVTRYCLYALLIVLIVFLFTNSAYGDGYCCRGDGPGEWACSRHLQTIETCTHTDGITLEPGELFGTDPLVCHVLCKDKYASQMDRWELEMWALEKDAPAIVKEVAGRDKELIAKTGPEPIAQLHGIKKWIGQLLGQVTQPTENLSLFDGKKWQTIAEINDPNYRIGYMGNAGGQIYAVGNFPGIPPADTSLCDYGADCTSSSIAMLDGFSWKGMYPVFQSDSAQKEYIFAADGFYVTNLSLVERSPYTGEDEVIAQGLVSWSGGSWKKHDNPCKQQWGMTPLTHSSMYFWNGTDHDNPKSACYDLGGGIEGVAFYNGGHWTQVAPEWANTLETRFFRSSSGDFAVGIADGEQFIAVSSGGGSFSKIASWPVSDSPYSFDYNSRLAAQSTGSDDFTPPTNFTGFEVLDNTIYASATGFGGGMEVYRLDGGKLKQINGGAMGISNLTTVDGELYAVGANSLYSLQCPSGSCDDGSGSSSSSFSLSSESSSSLGGGMSSSSVITAYSSASRGDIESVTSQQVTSMHAAAGNASSSGFSFKLAVAMTAGAGVIAGVALGYAYVRKPAVPSDTPPNTPSV